MRATVQQASLQLNMKPSSVVTLLEHENTDQLVQVSSTYIMLASIVQYSVILVVQNNPISKCWQSRIIALPQHDCMYAHTNL